MSKLLCIIPFYNEASRFETLLYDAIFVDHPEIDFLLIDDKSTDSTRSILNSLSHRFDSVNVLSLPTNVGKAEAIRAGILHSTEKKYDYIGYLDADLATPMSEFVKLYGHISTDESISIIMGSRIKLLGNKVSRSLKRHYFGRIFATIVSQFILKTPIYDTQCGAKIIKAQLASELFKQPFVTRWLFDVELLLRYKNKGYDLQKSVVELPLYEWTEMKNSKIKFTEVLSFPFQLIKIYYRYGR